MVAAVDSIRQSLVGSAVEKLGADTATVNKFAARAAMQPPVKTVLVETSPDMLASLGIGGQYVPVVAFCSALAADLGGFALLLAELKRLKSELTPPPAFETVNDDATRP